MKTKIGVDVIYVWEDNPGIELHGYISFGEWEDNANFDAFGVPDHKIFFYSSAEELPTLMTARNGSDFLVKSFEYRLLTVVDDE